MEWIQTINTLTIISIQRENPQLVPASALLHIKKDSVKTANLANFPATIDH